MKIKEIFSRDSYFHGILLAMLVPVIAILIVIPAGRMILMSSERLSFYDSGILLLCLIPNLLFMRYFIVKAKLEKTGKAILGITVILMLLFFIFVHKHPFNFPI